MKWYPFGFDFGNGDTDAVLRYRGEVLKSRIPTAFTRTDIHTLQKLGVEVEQNNFVIQYANEPFAYAFGNLALSQGVLVWSGRGDEQRYASHYALKAALVSAASLIPDKEFGLYLISGLPADLYTQNPSLPVAIKEAFDGPHRFTLDGGKTWRTCVVEVCTVVMEGAGALIAFGGEIGKTTECGVIDIGAETCDLYAQRGKVPMPEYCKNEHFGVAQATQLLCEAFQRQYGARTLSALEAREIMQAFAAGKKKYPVISVYGQPIDVKLLDDFAGQAVRQVGIDIVSFVASSWRQAGGAARFSPVLLIGGGYYYFYKLLKSRIPHLRAPEDPLHANALGYLLLAERLFKKRSVVSAPSETTAASAVAETTEAVEVSFNEDASNLPGGGEISS